MRWTPNQQMVIDRRDDNILVSASAGSGKTAVLVARILAYITDPDEPVDIDRLLIVTFTKAAAGEMKERIGKAIEDALADDPENENLHRQSSLIHNAQITTIDGFCSYVVRTYCHTIGIEPGFRVADEGEVRLLRGDVLKEVLEEFYGCEDEEKRARFENFVESFAVGKSDLAVEDAVLKVFDAAESQPWPEAWLSECIKNNEASDFSQLEQTEWMKAFMRDADLLIEAGAMWTERNLELTDRADGPSAYRAAAEDDQRFFTELAALTGYGDRAEYIRSRAGDKPVRLPSKKPAAGEDPALRDVFKDNRAESKAIRERLQNEIYGFGPDEVLAAMQANEPVMNALIEVTGAFLARYAERKREKKIADFADLEHFALRILRREDGMRLEPARELAGRFREVMCDEYQDSNYLQEAILTAVSRIEDGQNNYFCVGDVKQSIYGFRHARPDLFMKKFHEYRTDEGMADDGGDPPQITGRRIDLLQNFRSRHEVLDTANGIFEQLMIPEVGGVAYDKQAALVCGAAYPEAENGACDTEFLLAVTHEEDAEGNSLLDDESSGAARELEARMIAERISRLVRHEEIYDMKEGGMRPVRYRDIVILLRTMRGWADTFAGILEQQGIPAFSTAKSGYFTSSEVVTVLNYLAILDNPRQDIPYASILRSPIVGLSAEEMAAVRCVGGSPAACRDAKYLTLAECTRRYARGEAEVTDYVLKDKLSEFLTLYDELRDSVSYTPIHELIWMILKRTGYLDYASALPGGAQRAANLRMLTEKAIAYEETSYVGLFNFIRYIGSLRKYDVDMGGASVLGENEDVVRIVSIHKSKGLEYPVVFVAGGSKSFNRSDLNAALLIHPEYGIASDSVELALRVRKPTVKKAAVRSRLLRESVGEEMRVLYVALTRAKQKLILTGTIKDEETYDKVKELMLPTRVIPFPENYLLKARNPIAFLLPAVSRMISRMSAEGLPCPVLLRCVKPSELAVQEIKEESRFGRSLEILSGAMAGGMYDPEVRKIIEERFSYVYPYAGRESIPAKVSVSELKTGRFPDEETPERFPEPEIVPFIPDFMKKVNGSGPKNPEADGAAGGDGKKTSGGKAAEFFGNETQTERDFAKGAAPDANAAALRGTAYHRVMELLDFGRIPTSGRKAGADPGVYREELLREIRSQIDGFAASGRMLREEADLVDVRDIAAFAAGELGGRMADAFARKCLYREQPFTLGVTADQIDPEYPEDEQVLVQGIIDAYFYEGDSVVLIDYKTDRVRRIEELRQRYQIQIDSYREVLERVTGKKVSQGILWSFAMGRALTLPYD